MGHMTAVDSGGMLGIVMAVAVVTGIVLILLLWWKAGEDFDDDEEEELLAESESRTAGTQTASATRTDAEDQPGTSTADEPSVPEDPPDKEKHEKQ